MDGMAQSYFAKAKECLASAEDDLAKKRFNSCANRAYYACYQAAVAVLLEHGTAPRGEKGLWRHEFVHSQFGFLVKRGKLYPSKIKTYLPELMEARITADYKSISVSKKTTKGNLQKVEEFVSIVRKEEQKK